MKPYYLLAVLATAMTVASCNSTKHNSNKPIAIAPLHATADPSISVGEAQFYTAANGEIKMVLTITMPEKANSSVAVHFHEHGDCGDKGNNTHGHWNPTKEKHGKWGSASYHSGDIGNIALDAKGRATLTLSTNRWSITSGDINNIIGLGIIVHSGVDDYVTQPTGNSGPRAGCGVITRS